VAVSARTYGTIDVDDDGVFLDNATGETVVDARERTTSGLFGQYCWGRVLEIGLGGGWTRASIYANPSVTEIHTFEINSDVVDAWRGELAGLYGTVGDSPEDGAHTIDVGDLSVASGPYGAHPIPQIDSIVITAAPLDDAATLNSELADFLTAIGARVVIGCYDPAFAMVDWNCVLVFQDEETGLCVIICDRWAGNIRSDQVFRPGFGWVLLEDLTPTDG
jgi:SAM-dependent methyltransferase